MRIKRLHISGVLLMHMCGEGSHRGYSVLADAVPAGTEIVTVRLLDSQVLELVLRHDSFEHVAQGDEIPVIMPVMRGEGFLPMPADA
jgi:hypothetical protein